MPKVKLSLFYESLCPDCQQFITRQLGPNFDKFGKYLDIHLNSFGNAEMDLDPDTGKYSFRCQHGPPECLGSMLEACLIRKMTTSPVPTINCIESSNPRDPQNTKKVPSCLIRLAGILVRLAPFVDLPCPQAQGLNIFACFFFCQFFGPQTIFKCYKKIELFEQLLKNGSKGLENIDSFFISYWMSFTTCKMICLSHTILKL